jgi:hypothetical protein
VNPKSLKYIKDRRE